jgi:hypothetical protein
MSPRNKESAKNEANGISSLPISLSYLGPRKYSHTNLGVFSGVQPNLWDLPDMPTDLMHFVYYFLNFSDSDYLNGQNKEDQIGMACSMNWS